MRPDRHPGDDDHAPIDLSDLDGAFAAAPAPTTRALPDGRYHVQVEHVELTTGANAGPPLLKWKLRVRAPTGAGALLWKHHLVAPKHLAWLKHDLGLCGLQLDRLSDLPAHLARLFAIELDVTKRTRGRWENVYFNRRLDPVPPDDDTPF